MAQPFHAGGAAIGPGPLLSSRRVDFASIRRLVSKGYEAFSSSGASQALTFWSVWGLGTTLIPNIVEVFYTIRHYVRVFFTSSVTIRASDELYLQVFNWLAKRESERRFVKEYTAQTLSDGRASARPYPGRPGGWLGRPGRTDSVATKDSSRIKYVPAFRTTWFLYGKNLFAILRNDKHSSIAMFPPTSVTPVYDYYGPVPAGNHKESVTITCLGWSTVPIQKLLEACRDMAEQNRRTSVTIRTCRDQQWELSAVKPVRPLDTIHLDHDVKENLLNDIKKYLDPQRRRFYSEQGIPYRRGYLLYGPPGCGKSSLSLALACKFGLDLYMVNIANLYDGDLEYLFASLPARCLVLLEDIDAVGFRRPEDEDSFREPRHLRGSSPRSQRCSLSSLLNVLDGVASQEGRIVVMTTNHPELLDEALVRPGRIDVRVHMGYITKQGAVQIFMRMMKTARFDKTCGENPKGSTVADASLTYAPGAGPTDEPYTDEDLQVLASEFAEKIPADTFSPAQVQGYLLRYLHSATMARDGIAEWVVNEKRKREEKAKADAERREQRRQEDERLQREEPEVVRMPGDRCKRKSSASRTGKTGIIVQFPSLEALAKISSKAAAGTAEPYTGNTNGQVHHGVAPPPIDLDSLI